MLKNQVLRVKNACRRFLTEEDGMAVVEVILIIVVFIAMVMIFRDQLSDVIDSIFDTINSQSALV